MNSLLVSTHASSLRALPHFSTAKSFNLLLRLRHPTSPHFLFISSKFNPPHFIACCSSGPSSNGSNPSHESILQNDTIFHSQVRSPQVPSFTSPMPKFSFSDQAFFLLAFIACTVWPHTHTSFGVYL